jgi:hypothetical protein
MKKTIKLIGTIAIIFALVFSLTTCKDGSGKPEDEDDGGTGKHLSGAVSIAKSPGGNSNGSTFYAGDFLEVNYTGSEKVTYQWKLNGANIVLERWSYNNTGNPNSVDGYVVPAPGSLTVTVSAAGYNSKTSSPVTVIAGVPDPDFYGSWNDSYMMYTITADKLLAYNMPNVLVSTLEPIYWAPITNKDPSKNTTHPTGYRLTGICTQNQTASSVGRYSIESFYIDTAKTSFRIIAANNIYTKQP